jgi:hypothetical protein
MGPSKLYLEKLNTVLNNRRFSKVEDLDGFKGDVDSCFDLDGLGTPFRLMKISFTHDDLSRLIAEFEVVDQRPWAENEKEILRIWNEEVAYTHSEFEFTEDSSGQTFHFFTFEDQEPLFITGQLIFRRS